MSPPPQARWVAEDSQALKVMKAADVDEGLKDVTVDDAVAVSDGSTGFEDTLAAEKPLNRIIEAAVMEALPEGYTGKPFEWTDTASIGLKSHFRQLHIDGPGCADVSCLIRGPFIPEPFSEKSYKAHVFPMPA